jgi:uncharacterized membrane protein
MSESPRGIRTSEFWLTLVAMILVNLPSVFMDPAPQWVMVAGLIGSVLAAMGYGISRAVTKSAEGGGFVLPLSPPPTARPGDGVSES